MAKEIKYNPLVIKEYAAKLYGRADTLIAMYALLGGVLGLVLGYSYGAGLASGGESSGEIPMLLGAAIGGLLGYVIGVERGFALRLQAQVALCQVSMEANTLELRQLMSPTSAHQPSTAPQAYDQSAAGYQAQAAQPGQPGYPAQAAHPGQPGYSPQAAQPGQPHNPQSPPGGYHQR